MRELLSNTILLNRIRMLRISNGEITIAVEGASDVFFLSQFCFFSKTHFEIMYGYENVLELLKEANTENNYFLIGIVDRDFHEISHETGHDFGSIDNIVYTDFHDLEVGLFESEAFDKYLSIMASREKIKEYGNIRDFIYSSAVQVGATRLLSINRHLNLYFEGMDYKKILVSKNQKCVLEKLIKYIFHRTSSERKEAVKLIEKEAVKEVESILNAGHDQRILCNGHDILNLVGFYMRSCFASKQSSETTEEIIFKELLLSYQEEMFVNTQQYQTIKTLFDGLAIPAPHP